LTLTPLPLHQVCAESFAEEARRGYVATRGRGSASTTAVAHESDAGL